MRERLCDIRSGYADGFENKKRTKANKDASESADALARELMRVVNGKARLHNRITFEECRKAFDLYPQYEDFIRYGLEGFCLRNNLSKRQMLAVKNSKAFICAPTVEDFAGLWMGDWFGTAEIIHDIMYWEPVESVCVIYLDENMRITEGYKSRGRDEAVGLSPDDIYMHKPFGKNCSYIIAHNHLYGNYKPGMNDIRHTALMQCAANDNTCRFLDSVIAAGDYIHSIKLNRTLFLHPFQSTTEILREYFSEETKEE